MPGTFIGWPLEGPAFLAEIATDNTAEFWAVHRDRHAAAVLGPMRAMAAALEPEFGPVRVFRPHVNRRFRPAAPPYRTDTGAVATSAGGSVLGVVLSATALSVSAGHRTFDAGQLRRYRAAVAGTQGEALEAVLRGLPGLTVDETRTLTGTPRGHAADHPRIGLLRHRGLQVVGAWPVGAWLATAEPFERVRGAWRAAGPLLGWLDEHVGPADPAPPRPRPAPVAAGSG
jgi:hypothetical protein